MGPAFALVPRADYQIVDTWFVSGLRGTGSKDIEVREAFVPAHRVALLSDLNRGVSPGWDLHARPSYRLPVMLGLSGTIASPLVGIAQGGVDEVVARARNPKTGSRTAQSVPMQLRLAESAAEVDSARLILRHQAAGLLERAARGDLPDLLEQACYRRGFAYAARLSVHAVSRLFEGSGGHALYDSQAIQRHFRDVHAGSHHFVVSWDPQAEQYARAAFGLPTEGPTFARGNAPS